MMSLRSSIPPSIPADAAMLQGAVAILTEIEGLPADAAGVLSFGDRGTILVESGSICWAMASSMPQRLTELLRHQRNPPIDRAYLQSLVLECQTTHKPLGEALLASGHISETGLRSALFRQTAEAIAHMARMGVASTSFVPHASASYDARFRYAPLEVLSALGARNERALAASASAQLARTIGPADGPFGAQASGFACIAEHAATWPTLIASRGASDIPRALALGRWALEVFSAVRGFTHELSVVAGRCEDEQHLVAWRDGGIHFVACCSNAATSALVIQERIGARP